MLNLSPLFGVAYGSERSLHPLHLVSRSSFVSKVKQSDGCRPKPCKWSPPQWVEVKISWTRIAARHNAARSQDWWRNVQRAQNDASLKLKLPYKGFSGASCQLSLACGAQCQYCQCNECPLQVPECQISLGAQCQCQYCQWRGKQYQCKYQSVNDVNAWTVANVFPTESEPWWWTFWSQKSKL